MMNEIYEHILKLEVFLVKSDCILSVTLMMEFPRTSG
jgi:hypothetical protein